MKFCSCCRVDLTAQLLKRILTFLLQRTMLEELAQRFYLGDGDGHDPDIGSPLVVNTEQNCVVM